MLGFIKRLSQPWYYLNVAFFFLLLLISFFLTVRITINLQRRAAGMHVTTFTKQTFPKSPALFSILLADFLVKLRSALDTYANKCLWHSNKAAVLPMTLRGIDWSGDSQNGGILRFWLFFPRAKFCKGKSAEMVSVTFPRQLLCNVGATYSPLGRIM